MKAHTLRWIFFAITVYLAGGCTEPSKTTTKPVPESTPTPPAEAHTSDAPKKKEATPKSVPIAERVQSLVQEWGTRQACNRLNGCSLATELGKLGPQASAEIQALYLRTKGDALGRIKLVEAVALTGDRKAGPFLLNVLEIDRLPPARVEAAFGLARLGQKEHLPRIKKHAESLAPETHRPILLAIGFTLARLGDDTGVPMIEDLFKLPPENAKRWDPLRPGIRAAGLLRLQSLAPKLAKLTTVPDPYIRRDSIAALAQMRAQNAFPELIQCLEDEMPFVRRAALQALKQLTGFRYKETPDQWKRWWRSRTKPVIENKK